MVLQVIYVQQVRNYDSHHYLCLLELPASMQKAAFALRAFNVETSKAIDVASNPRIGFMRLVWWVSIISTAADHEASHVVRLVVFFYFLSHYHTMYVLAKVAENHGLLVKEGDWSEIRLDSREGLCDVVFEMASVANVHLLKARELAGKVPVKILGL
ncbi:hypothetical protein Pint_15934 [Pistacia integerrima]|uniref:Uncharacterized protein n=1 Tax=Pistacia integerrima TaxID=434235 RepID=A0ACC0ZD67_9ROSI|nr:hypothetical protein Pint_15934 [Pistacia integerrima]